MVNYSMIIEIIAWPVSRRCPLAPIDCLCAIWSRLVENPGSRSRTNNQTTKQTDSKLKLYYDDDDYNMIVPPWLSTLPPPQGVGVHKKLFILAFILAKTVLVSSNQTSYLICHKIIKMWTSRNELTSLHKIGRISANNGPIWKIQNLAHPGLRRRSVGHHCDAARDATCEMTRQRLLCN